MLSFASKATSISGALSNMGPLGKTVSLFVNSDLYRNVPTKELKLSGITIDHIYKKDHTVMDFSGYIPMRSRFKEIKGSKTNSYYKNIDFKKEDYFKKEDFILFEDPLKFDIGVLSAMNTYRFRYKKNIKSLFDSKRDGDQIMAKIASTDVSPSLFNPQYGIQRSGITMRTPLLNNYYPSTFDSTSPFDCSIKRLCADSLNPNGSLGVSTYRVVDFMFCKHLGKVPNNRLITLRKFAYPIGDHIGKYATPKYADKLYSYDTPGDVGRLIAWFDTEDNKLEDICKYEMQASWEHKENDLKEITSKEGQSKQPLNTIFDAINIPYGAYNNEIGGQNNAILEFLGSKIGVKPIPNDNADTLRIAANNNKVYKPKNTVRDISIYEGKLTLNQEINLVFSYKLRAYDNINPRSAFLDLMGNILNVTYTKGSYWAGENRLVGPPRNTSAWAKADAIIEKAWHKLGGYSKIVAAGLTDWESLQGALSNIVNGALESADKLAQGVVKKANEIGNDGIGAAVAKGMQNTDAVSAAAQFIKGMVKDTLGRPALYALDSLINGDDTGLWHLTIGNPYNPIMSIGNLLMETASIQHLGPLGLDDFPSEIKVSVTLKPARSRDLTEISRYYTQGLSTIYFSKVGNKQSEFHNFNTGGSSGSTEDKIDRNRTDPTMGKSSGIQSAGGGKDFNETISGGKSVIEENDTAAQELQKSVARRWSIYERPDRYDMNLKTREDGLIYATNNYSEVYHIRSYDEIDYA